MKPPKKPPPDTEGNVLGRISALKTSARRSAGMDAKDGGDYDKALAKHMKAIEPRLNKLRRRLAKVRKDQPATATEKPATKAQKATKKERTRKDAKGGGDILAALDAL